MIIKSKEDISKIDQQKEDDFLNKESYFDTYTDFSEIEELKE